MAKTPFMPLEPSADVAGPALPMGKKKAPPFKKKAQPPKGKKKPFGKAAKFAKVFG